VTGISFPPTGQTETYLVRGGAIGTAVGAAVTASNTRYAAIDGAGAVNATAANVHSVATRDLTIRSVEVRLAAPAGTGNVTARLYVNGSATGDTLTFTAGSGTTTQIGNTDVAVTEGQTVALVLVNANAVNDGTFYGARLELA